MGIIEDYGALIASAKYGAEAALILKTISLAVIIVILAGFIWYFYRSLSKKDLIALNLDKYNRSSHPVLQKLFALALYLLEYIVVIPFFILIWSIAMAIAIFLVSDRGTSEIMFLTGVLIISIRILSYIQKDIAGDLAKLFPFVTISVFLLYSDVFNSVKVFSQIKEIPLLLSNIYLYFITIFVVEIGLRVIDTIVDFWKSEENRVYFETLR